MPAHTAVRNATRSRREPLDPLLLLRLVARETMGIVLMAISLLLPAGRWDWPAAWVAIGLMAGWADGRMGGGHGARGGHPSARSHR